MDQKKTQPAFERCLDSAIRRDKKVSASLEEVRAHCQRGDIDSAYAAAFLAADHAEKLTGLMRELPAYTGHPRAHEMMEDALAQSFPITIGFTREGWFFLRLPPLLPKKSRGSPAYIEYPLYPAMQRFWRNKQPVRYPDNVAVFRHVYSRERPERQHRDHDNIELNRVLDVVALYVMVDDSPTRCRHYYCSAPGDAERTEIYIVPRKDFRRWLEQEDSIPEGGVPLYESLP